MLLSWLTSAWAATKASTLLWQILSYLLVAAISFAAGVYYETRSTRTELIVAQEKARSEGVNATKKAYDAALSAARDKTATAARERDAAKRDKQVAELRAKILSRKRVNCLFSDEDMKDINEAGKN